MKTKTLATILLLFVVSHLFSQQTYVPDNNFEQALIDLGYDAVLDDYVTTTNINTVETLVLSYLDIQDLTGIEDFSALAYLGCTGNSNLSEINVNANTALIFLYINETNISSIDLSANTALRWLYCNTTNLSLLDLSNNINLNRIFCQNTNISSLDLSNNSLLSEFYCVDSPNLTSLNLKNGNNHNVIFFNATNNPNLTCIEVDNEAYSTANWPDKDITTVYSIDCASLGIIEEDSFNFNIYPNPTKNKVTIQLKNYTELKNVTIYNNLGQHVLTSKETIINTSNLLTGIYIVEIQTNNGKASKKLIIE